MLFGDMAQTVSCSPMAIGIVSLVVVASVARKMEENNKIDNMRIKNGFELRDVCGEHIIIAHGVENIDFTKVITLNESAAFIWKKVEGKSFTEDGVVKMLLDEYEVEEAQARADVEQLLASWEKAGLMED